MLNTTNILDLLNPTTVVNDVGTWLIIAFLGSFWWIITRIIKKMERKKEKIAIIGRLLSEIERNQKLLQPLSYSVVKVLDSDDEPSEENLLPIELNFDSTIYIQSSDKLGLLDNKSREKLDQYYSDLKHIEDKYKKLELIHGNSYGFLRYLEFKELTEIKFHIIKPGWHEIEEFLRNTKKVYELGGELIINLAEKTGISVNTTKNPLTMEHLQPDNPNIRELWFDRKELKTQISKNKKKIREYIKNKSIEGIPLYSKLDKIFDDGDIFHDEYGDIINRTVGDEICGLVKDFVESGKLTKDEEYKEFVEFVTKDKTLYEIFEKLFENEDALDEKTVEIEKRLKKIVPDFDKRRNELKDWYES